MKCWQAQDLTVARDLNVSASCWGGRPYRPPQLVGVPMKRSPEHPLQQGFGVVG